MFRIIKLIIFSKLSIANVLSLCLFSYLLYVFHTLCNIVLVYRLSLTFNITLVFHLGFAFFHFLYSLFIFVYP